MLFKFKEKHETKLLIPSNYQTITVELKKQSFIDKLTLQMNVANTF